MAPVAEMQEQEEGEVNSDGDADDLTQCWTCLRRRHVSSGHEPEDRKRCEFIRMIVCELKLTKPPKVKFIKELFSPRLSRLNVEYYFQQ